jgi:phosphopantothenoylcysteine decarboxylase/phosphopantothenate--cysteine ligase
LALASVSGDKVYDELFSLTDEHEMGHIRLARDADLVLVAPATADLMAKMATGLATDLATTVLCATDRPVIMAPAMNPVMWDNPATRRNHQTLERDGVRMIGPMQGDMACGETGAGRMAEPLEILAAIRTILEPATAPLRGKRALVTSGPTHEPIDPVRYIANRSSGKQGHAIARALRNAGADVTLVSGPVGIETPPGVKLVSVETAMQMYDAVMAASGVDIAVFAAAVADWRPVSAGRRKIKKSDGQPMHVDFTENPDILATVSKLQDGRPALVIGFAAETGDLIEKAEIKRRNKGCDWIVGNDVAAGDGVFGSGRNEVAIIDRKGVENWPAMDKDDVAKRLVERIMRHFNAKS